jgi:nuclear transport factor 2 (NTF2) superfamily protein
MTDLLYFFAVPIFIIIIFTMLYRGGSKNYKIIKETNTLGESRYEVWFEYESLDCASRNWHKEAEYATLEEADAFIARQFKTRETVREGKLK